jgi:hypothetical protein
MSNTANPEPAPAEAPPSSRQQIDNPIDLGNEVENVRQATREHTEGRRKENYVMEDHVSEPVKIRYPHKGKDQEPETYKDAEPKKLRQVAADTADYHRIDDPDFKRMTALGADPAELLARIKDPERVRQLTGWTDAEAKEYARTGRMPTEKMGTIRVDGFGNLIPMEPLGDRPASELSAEETLNVPGLHAR